MARSGAEVGRVASFTEQCRDLHAAAVEDVVRHEKRGARSGARPFAADHSRLCVPASRDVDAPVDEQRAWLEGWVQSGWR
eukprot:1638291-Lingulodinium_polyedra.AAC.1